MLANASFTSPSFTKTENVGLMTDNQGRIPVYKNAQGLCRSLFKPLLEAEVLTTTLISSAPVQKQPYNKNRLRLRKIMLHYFYIHSKMQTWTSVVKND